MIKSQSESDLGYEKHTKSLPTKTLQPPKCNQAGEHGQISKSLADSSEWPNNTSNTKMHSKRGSDTRSSRRVSSPDGEVHMPS